MKLKRLFFGLVTMMIMTFGLTIMSYADDVSKAVTITPVEVSDINNEAEVSTWQNVIDCSTFTVWQTTDFYYKMTIDKPSYVRINVFNNISDYSFYGLCNVYVSKNNIFSTPSFKAYLDNDNESKIMCLEPGEYYIKLAYEMNGVILNNKNACFSVYTQGLSRTGSTNGTTIDKSIVLNEGGYGEFSASGAFTDEAAEQWFKFTVDSKSDVTIVTTTSKFSLDKPSTKIELYNESSLIKGLGYDNEENKVINNKVTLDAGTYYIKTFHSSGFYSQTEQKITIEDVYAPSAPTVKAYKSGTKFIKGNAEIGSTVYAKIGKKTYSAVTDQYGVFKISTPALKVGNKITVYAKDECGNKSSNTKVTVKNKQIAKPKVKAAKANTKLVKGTAKKGTTVYVTYNGKTFKKKVTSKNFSVKVNKVLVKGKAVKVKVVDSYGNYSKTVTYKVK